MNVHFSVVGILLSALAAMVIGAVWYRDDMFGKRWKKIAGVTDKDMRRRMPTVIPVLVVISLLTAIVLSNFIAYTHQYYGGSWLSAGIKASLLAWAGFGLTSIFAHGLFESRDNAILYINGGNRLVTLLAMGLILGAFMN